jgi:acyl-coenzyme A thioesterase PaaI-like protein
VSPPGAEGLDLEEEARLTTLIEASPYLHRLGITATVAGAAATLHLTYSPDRVGFRALHAGPLAALLEAAASLQLRLRTEDRPRLASLTMAYLRPGLLEDTFARAHIVKRGRRVCNVRAEAWQSDPARPIATAEGVFLLRQER